MDRLRASAKTLGLIAVAILLGAGAYAVASIPGSDGVITACWYHAQDGARPYGALRVIDPSLAGTGATADQYSCQSSETQITWNQQGPTGPTGPSGPQGPTGLQGPRAPSSILSFGGGGKPMFLKIPEVKGESKIPNHKGEIELQSVSFGATPAKPKTGEIIVVKRVDSTSPSLFQRAASGKPYPDATIELTKKKGGKLVDYLVFKMKTVLITSVKSVNHGSDPPSEQLTLSFQKLSEEFMGNSHTTIHLTPHQITLP